MNFQHIKVVLLFILIFCSQLTQAANKPNGDREVKGWELITESNGIEVFERWIQLEPKLKIRERTGRMILNASVDEVLGLIADVSKAALWMKNVEEVALLKSISKTEWYQRTVLDAPWPFSKQDMVSKYIVHCNPEKTEAHVIIKKESELFPKQDGINRLDSFNALWEVIKINDHKVRVVFTTTSTKPPEYPTWVQDPIVRNIFFSNLRNFKKLISQKGAS